MVIRERWFWCLGVRFEWGDGKCRVTYRVDVDRSNAVCVRERLWYAPLSAVEMY
jgi:hypothetical protein